MSISVMIGKWSTAGGWSSLWACKVLGPPCRQGGDPRAQHHDHVSPGEHANEYLRFVDVTSGEQVAVSGIVPHGMVSVKVTQPDVSAVQVTSCPAFAGAEEVVQGSDGSRVVTIIVDVEHPHCPVTRLNFDCNHVPTLHVQPCPGVCGQPPVHQHHHP
ncbi:hypothetical protein C0992_003582 [Termitomyces sp. T32_za158]|nr:hypothetical protein C0992_003582 [Termitomyces sp. T32_za158]